MSLPPSQEHHRTITQNNTSSPSVLTPLETPLEIAGWDFKILDFELLHFYTSTTAITRCDLPRRQYVWQHVVPKIAFSHHFLLHGLLAFAALHMAHLDPARRKSLHAEASRHHDAALTAFRPIMQNITAENCNACFAFSSTLALYAWASPDCNSNLVFADTSSPVDKDATVEWVRLIRGTYSLLLAAQDWMSDGPLQPLLSLYEGQPAWAPHEAEPTSILDPEVQSKFTALKELWEPSSDWPEPDHESVEALKEALSLLQEAYSMLCSEDKRVCFTSVVFSWPIRVPEKYITMVNKRVPQALVILAHYSLLLNKLGDFWWMNGMSRHLLQTVHRTLGKKWESWISWPLQDLVLWEFNNRE